MTTCDNCNGEGLVGQGDNPRLKIGRLDRCTVCNGTGKISDVASDDAPAATESQAVDPEIDKTVDNETTNEDTPKPGFFARLFGA